MTPLSIERYQLKGELGAGGQGTVFLAYDPKLDRDVALKVLKEEALDNATALARFHREAKATAKLHHSNIVEVFDYSDADSPIAFIVTERLEGKNLDDLIAVLGRPLPADVVAAAGYEICLALQHAHGRGIIHRDLKPENVFLEPSGRLVLCDFGLARPLEAAPGVDALTSASQVLGTPMYMAPEQIHRETLTSRTDLFSLGSLLQFLLTGEHAFAEENMLGVLKRIVAGAAHDLREARPDTPPKLLRLIEELHRRDPNERPATAEAVAERLFEVVGGEPRRVLQRALASLQAETGEFRALPPKPLSGQALDVAETAIHSLKASKEQGTQIATVAALSAPEPAPRASWLYGLLLLVPLVAASAWRWWPRSAASPVMAAAPESPPLALPAPAAPVDVPAPPPTEVSDAPEVGGNGTVRFVVLPWADIYVDGQKIGTTPGLRTHKLQAGKHRVRAVNPAFKTIEKTVEVRRDATVNLSWSFDD